MLLAIDIGNTNIVFGIFKNEKIVFNLRVKSNKKEFYKLDVLSKYSINNIIISSVVPYLTKAINQICSNQFKIDPFIVKYNNVPSLNLNIENPSQIGNDRICNTFAASKLYTLPAIVVDMGTATKYDVINSNGTFIGGVIAPGIELSAINLFEKAALLSKTNFIFPKNVIGKNTKSNIQSGIMYGSLDAINGMIKRIIKETEWNDCSIIITGGFSSLIKNKLDQNFIFDSNLTLKGLQLIFQNKSIRFF